MAGPLPVPSRPPGLGQAGAGAVVTSEQSSAESRHDYLDAVKNLLVAGLGDRVARGVEDYLDLFSATGVLETPYGAHEERVHVVGRADLAHFVESLRGHVVLTDFQLRGRYLSDDGMAVLEYDGRVHQPQRGIEFHQSYVAVIRTEHGRIELLREYSDPSRASGSGPAQAPLP